jgi:3-oxosteroid 1-dehydrogenase
MTDQWDAIVDVLVAGTGAAGLTAAITAADRGLDVLVVESTSRWGGTTSVSGGGLWMSANPLMLRDGDTDSAEEALRYMDEVIGDAGSASSPERRKAFVQTAPEVVAFQIGDTAFEHGQGEADAIGEVPVEAPLPDSGRPRDLGE